MNARQKFILNGVWLAVLCLVPWTGAHGQAVCPAVQSTARLTWEEARQQDKRAFDLTKDAQKLVEARQYSDALNSYNEAYQLVCSLNETLAQGMIEYLTAQLYTRLGSYETASTLNDHAVEKFESVPSEPELVKALDLRARLYSWQSQFEKSITVYENLIAIESRLRDYVRAAESLNGLAQDYIAIHQDKQALLFNAAAFRVCSHLEPRDGKDLCAATTLHIRSLALYNLAEYDASCASALTGLGFAQLAAVAEEQNTAQADLMRCAFQAHYEHVALLSGIEAVNGSQALRSQVKDLSSDIRSAYKWRVEAVYVWLADKLFDLGRIEEAEFILDLFKQSQISADTGSLTDPVITEWQSLISGSKSGSSITTLMEKAVAFAKATDAKAAKQPLPESLFTFDSEREALLSQVEQNLPSPATVGATLISIERRMGSSSILDTVLPRSDIPALIKALGPGTMVVYTVTVDEHVGIAVTTTSGSRYFTLRQNGENISADALQQLVESALAGTDQSSGEPWDDLQALDAILIAPLRKDILATAKASPDGVPTILWSMDSFMRSVPLNALYDGNRYLVEEARNVYLIPEGHSDLLKSPVTQKMTMLALGKSNFTDLAMLDKVERELDYIVKDQRVATSHGPIPGWLYKNDSFTLKALQDGLTKRPAIVHLATHFVLKSESPVESYLALTDEMDKSKVFSLTLNEFETDRSLDFSNVSLVTLSACGTGQPNQTLGGREIDSLAATAERRGATSVLGTLWSVDDDGTGELMGDFYGRWSSHFQVGKGEALRQAQLDLLYGRVGTRSSNYKAFLFAESPDHHNGALSRPYYWASYSITGNFR